MAQGDTLTPKQSAFVSLVSRGVSQVEAYLRSYDTKNTSRQVASQEGKRLMKIAKVKDAIDNLKADSKLARLTQETLTRDWIIDKLQAEATCTDSPASSRVRALEILAKSHGLFSDSTQVIVEARSSEEIALDLRAKLDELLLEGIVVNGEPKNNESTRIK